MTRLLLVSLQRLHFEALAKRTRLNKVYWYTWLRSVRRRKRPDQTRMLFWPENGESNYSGEHDHISTIAALMPSVIYARNQRRAFPVLLKRPFEEPGNPLTASV